MDELEDLNENQFIINTKQFKLCSGKKTSLISFDKPKYYDIPPVIMDLLKKFNHIGEPIKKYNIDWWNYHSRKIYYKTTKKSLEQGIINYLRICKSKWIENLDIPLTDKNILHQRMNHTYQLTTNYYL